MSGAISLELLHIRDGVVGHCRGQIPAGIALKRIDGGRIAEQVRLPLAGVAADKPVEIIEAHPDRPLIERPGLARLIKGRVVVLAEPRGRVAVLLENLADRAAILLDHRVVPREPGRRFAHDAIAGHVMVAAGDQCGARRRTERRGMKLRVPQSVLCDAIQRRRRDDAAERARRAEPAVIGHDEQHIGRALRRHDARRPPRFRLGGLLLDHSAELRIGRRELFAVDGGRGAGRAQLAGDLLGLRGYAQARTTATSPHERNVLVVFIGVSPIRLLLF